MRLDSLLNETCANSGLEIPRSRFAPVKRTLDLILLMSDRYEYDNVTGTLQLSPDCNYDLASLQLDGRFYEKVADAFARMPQIPSMRRMKSLTVVGDVHFGRDVVLEVGFHLDKSKRLDRAM